MKLVSAKCPNCGAKIDVDGDSDRTKCNYCESLIIVEDAIQNFKIGIVGEIEVKNYPKIENLLKNANRNYKNNEYLDAYDLYCRVLELNPDNLESILRRGFCKFLETGYSDANIKIVLNSIKDVYEVIEDTDDRLFDFIEETFDIVVKYEMLINEMINSTLFSLDRLQLQQKKLISCLEVYDYLYNISNDNNQELKIIRKIIDSCDNINSPKKYENDEYMYGNNIKTYYFSLQDVREIRDKYYEILLGMDFFEVKNILED